MKYSVVLCDFSVQLCASSKLKLRYTEDHRGDTELHRDILN
jgi:hypothetical protein